MGAWGFVAFVAILIAGYFLICEISLKHIVDGDNDFLAAMRDALNSTSHSDDGIAWHPNDVLPEEKGRYWTRHPEAPNHVFEGTRWNGNMWISEDGHPCYFQQREWAYPVEQVAA